MLTQNSKLKKSGIWGFGLAPGMTCPASCKVKCYAAKGMYARHCKKISAHWDRNLSATMRLDFEIKMIEEIDHNGCQFVRIHSEGDFYSQEYLNKWISIAKVRPEVIFYAYTKMHTLDYSRAPGNLKIIHSLGGDDSLVDLSRPHARIFSSAMELAAAGYVDCSKDDLLSITSGRIGLISH